MSACWSYDTFLKQYSFCTQTWTVISHESKSAPFEWSFNWQYFWPWVRKITLRCIISNAEFKWWSGPSFELQISNYASRRNSAYTRSKIPSFEWSFKLRISNSNSNCALLLSCENNHRQAQKYRNIFQIKKKIHGFPQKAGKHTSLVCFHVHCWSMTRHKCWNFVRQQICIMASWFPKYGEK